MCKPWPGLRCTDHPQKKLQKYSVRLHEKHKALSEIDTLMHGLSNGLSEEQVKEDASWKEANSERTKILQDITELNDKYNQEVINFHTTKGGQEELQAKIDDTSLPVTERLDAALDKSAADERRDDQKEMGKKVINNPEATDEEKIAYAEEQDRLTKLSIRSLTERSEKLEHEIAKKDKQMDRAQAVNDKEALQVLKQEKNKLVQEKAFVDKRLAQQIQKRKELKAWIARFYDRNTDKIFRLNEKLIRSLFRFAW